jgi:hypothetical protein
MMYVILIMHPGLQDSSAPSPERIELSTITRTEDGDIVHITLKDAQVIDWMNE